MPVRMIMSIFPMHRNDGIQRNMCQSWKISRKWSVNCHGIKFRKDLLLSEWRRQRTDVFWMIWSASRHWLPQDIVSYIMKGRINGGLIVRCCMTRNNLQFHPASWFCRSLLRVIRYIKHVDFSSWMENLPVSRSVLLLITGLHAGRPNLYGFMRHVRCVPWQTHCNVRIRN